MIAARMVRLIESHSEKLANGLIEKVHKSDRAHDLLKVPAAELRERSQEVYRNLGEWLLNKTEKEIADRYRALGARRAEQGIRYSHFLWALVLTKEHLWHFLQREGAANAIEIYQQLELLHLLDGFFERALYYAAQGYEQARAAHAA
jgi:hypothetical protein